MDDLQIIILSSKSAFTKKIRRGLKSFHNTCQSIPSIQVNQITSIDELSPDDIKKSPQIVLVDKEALGSDLDKGLQELNAAFPQEPLVLVADSDSPLSIQDNHGFYSVDDQEVESPLFLTFIYALANLSELIQENAAVQEKLRSRENELLSLRNASLQLTMNLSLDAVLDSILESALELLSADDTHVFLYEHGVLSFAAALFDGHQQNEPYMHPRPHGLTYRVAREGTLLVVNDTMTDPLFEDRRWEGSIIGLPLKIGNQVLGVMTVGLKRSHTFSEDEIRALKFLGDQAAIAIQNAKLYEQAQQEIADREKAEKAIKHLANHDALTGLPNRRLFNERIIVEISRAQRNNQVIGVMLFDLDHLKKVNDSFGHNTGDLLLQAVAQRMVGLLRKSDTIARMGGDEFLLILPEMQQPNDAVNTADRILAALSKPFHLEGYQVNITTSIGIAFYPDDGDEVDILIKKADVAMYKAKEKGGNAYHFYTP